jgi:hypothetical protein
MEEGGKEKEMKKKRNIWWGSFTTRHRTREALFRKIGPDGVIEIYMTWQFIGQYHTFVL